MTTTYSAPRIHSNRDGFWVAVDVFRNYGGLDDYETDQSLWLKEGPFKTRGMAEAALSGTKPGRGGKRAGAGRPRLSPDGALRKRRTVTVTDAEYTYLREALDYLRATLGAQDRDTCPGRD
jgi:hypothetical protein